MSHFKPTPDFLRYSEAIAVLYNANIFAFKGASAVLRFRALLPATNWNRLRRINMSTVFLVPREVSRGIFGSHHSVPPENYDAWERACSTVGTLTGLHLVTVDMTIWNYHDYKSANTIPPDDLISILDPLKRITARVFDVEINTALPEAVNVSLGPLPFNIKQRHRPYKADIFRQG